MKHTAKRSLLLLLSLLLILSFSALAWSAEDLPAEGATVNGFLVKEVGYDRLMDAPTVLFEHIKTGSQVLYIANNDTNRAFDINFRTVALDQTGLPHVFEHICISGSDKYPAQNIFFPVMSQTYNTFVNAMTNNLMTSYPLASLSEEQLLLLADYYLDGVFHPRLYEDERYYRREAWRYDISDPEEPLTITGTVYNEMRGNQVIDWEWQFNLYDALYPGSYYKNNYGGHPDYIPDMTYESLLEFHQTYYHPSNALTLLYGDLNYSKFLILLDGYFGQYEQAVIEIPDGRVTPLTQAIDKTYQFPVEQSSNTDKGSILAYAFVANDISAEDKIGLLFLSVLLDHSSSPLRQALNSKLPGATVGVNLGQEWPDPYLLFLAMGVDESDKTTLKNTVDQTLQQIARDGFDQSIIDAVIASETFSTLTMADSSSAGINLLNSTAYVWSVDGNLNYFNDILDFLDSMEEKAKSGYFQQLIRTYLLNNNHRGLVSTVPVAGLAEENQATAEAKLAEIKAAMSEEELAALIAANLDLAAWSQEEAPRELIQSLQAVSVSTLPEEVRRYNIRETQRDGLRFLTAEANTADIGYTNISLDISGIALDDLHYMQLYTGMLGSLATEKYSASELAALSSQHLNNFYVGISPAINTEDNSYHPYLEASWRSLNSDYKQSLDLANQVLFQTKFDDLEEIAGIIGRLRNNQRMMIQSYPYNIMLLRGYAVDDPAYRYYSYLSGLEFYEFLSELELQMAENPQAVVERLEAIQAQVSNRYGATVLYAGNAAGITEFDRQISGFFSGVESTPFTAADYSGLPVPARSEAIAIDSNVQYNMLLGPLTELNLTASGKFQPLNLFLYDAYLTPQIRHGLGAYDNLVIFDNLGLAMVSYRDPGVAATYEVYAGIGNFLRTTKITQEDLDGYILKAYTNYALPQGELNGAVNALYAALAGYDYASSRQLMMREIKSFSVQDVRNLAAAFDAMSQNGITSTVGAASIIEANSDRFDAIYYPDGESTGSGLTRGQVISLLFGGADEAIELAVEAGILQGDASGYREEEAATRQEVAIFLYRGLELTPAESLTEISDLAAIPGWAQEAVQAVLELGLLALDGEGQFQPSAPVSQGELENAILQYVLMLQEDAA